MSGGWALFVTCDADTGSDTVDLWGEGNVSPISHCQKCCSVILKGSLTNGELD